MQKEGGSFSGLKKFAYTHDDLMLEEGGTEVLSKADGLVRDAFKASKKISLKKVYSKPKGTSTYFLFSGKEHGETEQDYHHSFRTKRGWRDVPYTMMIMQYIKLLGGNFTRQLILNDEGVHIGVRYDNPPFGTGYTYDEMSKEADISRLYSELKDMEGYFRKNKGIGHPLTGSTSFKDRKTE